MRSPSSTAGIESWLDALSPPEEIRSCKRKRRRDSAHESDLPHKRAPLGELLAASMSNRSPVCPRAQKPGFSQSQGPESPTKQSRQALSTERQQWRVVQEQGTDGDNDLCATPKASPALRSIRAESASDTSSNRSASPTKMAELAGLSGTGNPLQTLHNGLGDIGESHPLYHLLGLLEEVQRFSCGVGIVTPEISTDIEAHALSREDFRYVMASAIDATPLRRHQYGRPAEIARALRLVAETKACKTRQEGEPAWNCRVHYPLLRMALDDSVCASDLEVADITTARIQPISLLPPWHSGVGLRSKLVDFAISLKADKHLETVYPNLDPLELGLPRSFNSTCLNTVLQEPIAISIETKDEDGHNNQAMVQLFTWSMAQLERLRKFAESSHHANNAPPALPLLSAHGSAWKMYAITWTEGPGYVLWELFNCGSTDTSLGFYKVFAILQLLMYWANTQYRNWLRSAIPLVEI